MSVLDASSTPPEPNEPYSIFPVDLAVSKGHLAHVYMALQQEGDGNRPLFLPQTINHVKKRCRWTERTIKKHLATLVALGYAEHVDATHWRAVPPWEMPD